MPGGWCAGGPGDQATRAQSDPARGRQRRGRTKR